MKHTKWIITVFGLAVSVMALTGFTRILASPITKILQISVYLPIVIKQESPTPAPTSTNTLSPTPTNTPPPISTIIPPGIQILPNHSYYVDSINYLHIVGEVLNYTPHNLALVKISVYIFNSSEHLLDTANTYTYLDNLPAWNKTCFELLLPEPSGWAYYKFQISYTVGQSLPNLTVLNDSGSYNPTYEWYEIIGQVRNDHGSRVEYVSPVSTIYNASGTVVGCDFTYVNSTHLDPGQISSFKLTFVGRDYTDVTSYRLQVDGYP
jgi:hypothetical protein